MRVVLFCGGLGMRMRDGVTTVPKPLAMIWDPERSGLNQPVKDAPLRVDRPAAAAVAESFRD